MQEFRTHTVLCMCLREFKLKNFLLGIFQMPLDSFCYSIVLPFVPVRCMYTGILLLLCYFAVCLCECVLCSSVLILLITSTTTRKKHCPWANPLMSQWMRAQYFWCFAIRLWLSMESQKMRDFSLSQQTKTIRADVCAGLNNHCWMMTTA